MKLNLVISAVLSAGIFLSAAGCGDTGTNLRSSLVRSANDVNSDAASEAHPKSTSLSQEEPSEPVLKVDDDADLIVRKAVNAHGGEKSFSCWRCGHLKYKTTAGIFPPELGEVTMEDTFDLPVHNKRVVRGYAKGKDFVWMFVTSHGKGWKRLGQEEAEPFETAQTSSEHYFASLVNLEKLTYPGARFTKIGTEEVDAETTIGIKVNSEELGEVTFYFRQQTGLLARTKKLLPEDDPAMKLLERTDPNSPITMESYLEDYRDVQGVKIPMRISGVQNGKPIIDVTLIAVSFADHIDDKAFAKP